VARRAQGGAAGPGTLFVSEENMLGSMRRRWGGKGLLRDAGARVAALAQPFAAIPELTLALAIRSLDDWWVSANAFAQGTGACGGGAGALALRSRRLARRDR
jgi:hypothetical protein